ATNTLFVWDAASGTSSQLLACEDALCRNPVWRPDGGALAFERITPAGAALELSRVWVMDMTSKTVRPLFQDNQLLGEYPRWSPDGMRLAASSPDPIGIRIHDFTTNQDAFVPTLLDEIANFSPDSKWLAIHRTVTPSKGKS